MYTHFFFKKKQFAVKIWKELVSMTLKARQSVAFGSPTSFTRFFNQLNKNRTRGCQYTVYVFKKIHFGTYCWEYQKNIFKESTSNNVPKKIFFLATAMKLSFVRKVCDKYSVFDIFITAMRSH